ncbi:MAG TPA: hypothetical protein VF653_12040 [Methylomirabilota bacterium]
MSDTGVIVTLSPRDHDAVLLDLDGVLTRRAGAHAAALEDALRRLPRRSWRRDGERFVPFDVGADYRRYVDGKPRYRRDRLPKAHGDHVP